MFTASYLLIQLEFILRLIIGGICGAVIGYERKNRLKEAGIRTHLIVALAATLMMIISKYGFGDIIQLDGVSLDPSRVAAQIISGIGFLGAGIIFVRKQVISGLTTAAGIWATAGVGMAIGAGMYIVGIVATLLIILNQVILHRNLRWLKIPVAETIVIRMNDDDQAIAYLQEKFEQNNIQIINLKAEKHGNGFLDIELYAKFPEGYQNAELMNLFKDNPYIKSFEI